VTAPAGILLASADSLALGSERKVTLASANDAEISAGRNLFMRAARGLSMFAHALGMKLVAGRGNVSVQAHQGNVEIKASGRISLIAAEGIDLQAPEVKVVAQGAQTDWGRDGITQQCADKHILKATQFVRLGPGGGTPAALNLPSTKMPTDERIVLRHEQTGEPIRNQRYRAHLADGRTIDGTTDDTGRTSLAVSDAMGEVHFDFLPSEKQH